MNADNKTRELNELDCSDGGRRRWAEVGFPTTHHPPPCGVNAPHNVHMRKFSGSELKDALAGLPGWSVVNGKLHKEYKFADFIHAFGFMATAALAIEKMNHHPEWFNVYNRVTVDLATHDAGGITSKDVDLAKLLDATASKLQ